MATLRTPSCDRPPAIRHSIARWCALTTFGLALIGCGQDGAPNTISPTTDVAADVATDGATAAADVAADGATGTPDVSADVAADVATDGATAAAPRRVLLIIADDLGVDQIAVYSDIDGDDKPDNDRTYPTAPTLNGICTNGIRFTAAWSAPVCSPTRATILTGRYGFRTGMGSVVTKKTQIQLSETTLPELLTPAGVAAANIGKWHLGEGDPIGGANAPNKAGWPHFAGTLGGTLDTYTPWERTVNGVKKTSNTYATTANVDDAIDYMKTRSKTEPWLLWMAFNAPHSPFHKPPNELHDSDQLNGKPPHIKNQPVLYYNAMVQALDTEVGRLITWLKANGQAPTHIIFIGDNGSPGQVATAPWDGKKAKGTLFEGGIRVPFCIAGDTVAKPGISGALVHTVDLFATIAALFGVKTSTTAAPTVGQDSQDLAPLLANPKAAWRDFNYSELFGNPQGSPDQEGRAITDGQFKLIQYASGAEAFFDLIADRHETKELKALGLSGKAKQAYDALSVRLSGLK